MKTMAQSVLADEGLVVRIGISPSGCYCMNEVYVHSSLPVWKSPGQLVTSLLSLLGLTGRGTCGADRFAFFWLSGLDPWACWSIDFPRY